MKTKPYAMLLMMLAGWINRQQQEAISFLMEENKILKHELLKATGKKQIILNQIQKRRLGILAKRVGRKMLFNISCVFAPDTLLKWFRQLAGRKYDGFLMQMILLETAGEIPRWNLLPFLQFRFPGFLEFFFACYRSQDRLYKDFDITGDFAQVLGNVRNFGFSEKPLPLF